VKENEMRERRQRDVEEIERKGGVGE